MHFRIAGRVYEEESGQGVQGLLIRAFDKDLKYDDLLGTSITDEAGKFEMHYSESDFRELFEHQPDIYLSVYAPPFGFLMDTKDAIRWNAGKDEVFELAIPRKVLGDYAPAEHGNQVAAGITLPKGSLKIEKRDGFDVPHLRGFATTGRPGAPAVPHQMRYVALPLGGDVLKFEVIPGEPVRIEGPFNPLPAQEPFPDVGDDPRTGGGFSIENVQFRMTPPDPRFFEGRKRYPEQLARLIKVEEVGAVQIAAVEVRPVQYDAATRSFLFYPRLKYVLTFDREKARRVGEERRKRNATVGELYAENLNTFLRSDRVTVVPGVFEPGLGFVMEAAPHLIITDNFRWPESVSNDDGTTRAPAIAERGTALAGDLVAEFQRLADWRTSQGIRSRVVTISDIVDGPYGDFAKDGFALDLQEVIRNFLKFAHEEWGTLYVVLGGDVNVVPMRHIAGSRKTGSTFSVRRIADNPPPEERCHFLAGHSAAKLHPAFVPLIDEPLSTYHGGIVVPYNREAGPTELGWYFTTAADFNGKDEDFTRRADNQPTQFVIVEGPADIVDDDFYWVRDVNSVPTDFYYASLVGPGYSVPGKHDFDHSGNGLYGQMHYDEDLESEVTLDNVDFNSDVWVGRVPAESAAHVRAFVNKVITYEDLRTPGSDDPNAPFVQVDSDYLRKVLYAAAYWGKSLGIERQTDTSIPPDEGTFTHEDGSTVTKINPKVDVEIVSGNPTFRLVAKTSTGQTVIPYDTTEDTTSAGWLFTTSDSYSTQSASATSFVKVSGPEEDINPDEFFWDPVGLESAFVEKEAMRGMMNEWFSEFDEVERHYSDYFDLDPPPPIVPLTRETVRAAINTGQHFLSMTGHGSWSGCCGVRIDDDADFSNSLQYFIAFADSCSTGRPDASNDSLAEISLLDPNGGAVAYVGNTRYSWIGTGNNYEQFFWCMLKENGRVGPAAGLRLATDGVRSIWTFYAQTLYGDPAMPAWDRLPAELVVRFPDLYQEYVPIEVTLDGKWLRDARVTLTGGTGERKIFLSKKTNSYGRVTFAVPEGDFGEVRITVSSREGKLYRGVVRREGKTRNE